MTTFDGPPVDTEVRVGALTFGGFLEELAERFGDEKQSCRHTRRFACFVDLPSAPPRGASGSEGIDTRSA